MANMQLLTRTFDELVFDCGDMFQHVRVMRQAAEISLLQSSYNRGIIKSNSGILNTLAQEYILLKHIIILRFL